MHTDTYAELLEKETMVTWRDAQSMPCASSVAAMPRTVELSCSATKRSAPSSACIGRLLLLRRMGCVWVETDVCVFRV